MNIYTKSYENIYYISHLSIKPQHRTDHTMENREQDKNYNILAPRPWRSFTDSQTSAMVVRKRRAPPPPLQKIVINDGSEEVLMTQKRRAPTPPLRTVSLKSPFEDRNEKEQADDTNLNDSPRSSVFDPDSSDQSIQQIFSYETTSPISPISFKSSMELEISVDGGVMEEDVLESQTSKTEKVYPDSSYEKIYDDENNNEAGNITSLVEETHCLEETVITEKHIITNSEVGMKTEMTEREKIVLRNTNKKIDLIVRTSQIEDLEEDEILKECIENEGPINTSIKDEKTDEQEDEADFMIESEKRKSEIILKVEQLEESLNDILTNSFPVSTDDLSLTHVSPSRMSSSTVLNVSPITGQKLSITGWTEFSKGKR